jgi:hypothetical protein
MAQAKTASCSSSEKGNAAIAKTQEYISQIHKEEQGGCLSYIFNPRSIEFIAPQTQGNLC